MAEDIIDQRLRYRNNLIQDRSISFSWNFKTLFIKTLAYFIATIFCILNSIFILYLMCTAFFDQKNLLCEITKSTLTEISIPLFFSIFLALVSVLVPFFVEKYFKYYLGVSLMFSSSSLIFLITYTALYYKDCNYAKYSFWVFILLLAFFVLITITFLVIKYYLLKKFWDSKFPVINRLYDEEQRHERIEERSKSMLMVNDTIANRRINTVEESLISA